VKDEIWLVVICAVHGMMYHDVKTFTYRCHNCKRLATHEFVKLARYHQPPDADFVLITIP
jgi:hypothetical protein